MHAERSFPSILHLPCFGSRTMKNNIIPIIHLFQCKTDFGVIIPHEINTQVEILAV